MVQVALEFYIITFQRNEVGTWYVASIFELKVQRIKIKDSMKNNKKKKKKQEENIADAKIFFKSL